ncbi:MAG TPA: twin-arginine translocase subunit TatC [Nevskiaceae bacterium]|nr:twin-arginine translocase subunit TatC [Nevskiaceae bacterium]
MKRIKSKAKKRLHASQSREAASRKLPFIEHIHELRKRLFYIAVSIGVFSAAAYGVEHYIVKALLKPAEGQEFIYTSPGGGIDFLFRVCLYTGIAASVPVIVFQLLRYLEPLVRKDLVHFAARGSIISGILALAGMAFGYFIGLPAALHFLLHQFKTDQIEPLLTIQSYMSFVLLYMLGSAMLFQLPLILVFINRIKPLKPQKLLKYERWIILGAFVGGGILNPTPSIIDQLMLAGPIIVMYQVGVLLIWLINRRHRRPRKVSTLLSKDAQLQAERLQSFQQAQAALQQTAQRSAASPYAASDTSRPAIQMTDAEQNPA